jgi:hypothetical protein
MLPSLTLMNIAHPEMVAHLAALQGAERSYLASLIAETDTAQKRIQRARKYYDGDQFVVLTDRLREFLGDDLTLTDAELLYLDIISPVIDAVVEKLNVRGFDSDEEESAEGVKPFAQWASQIWQRNRMDVRQDDIHTAALRDGEAFVIVDWDIDDQIPRFTVHKRYVDPAYDGDGDGCKMVYRNNDPEQTRLFAVKRWTETYFDGGSARQRYRMTVYYPDSVEKWASVTSAIGTTFAGWEPFTDSPDEPWPIPWVDGSGNPLGIAVIPFRNYRDDQEIRKVIPIQNAVNKAFVDLMTESDSSAFRQLLAFGWKPVDEDGNPLVIGAGRWQGHPSSTATAMVIPGVPLDNYMNEIDFLKLSAAQISSTPINRFITTKQIASEGTQKQGDTPLTTKIIKRQTRLGNAYEDMMFLGARLHNAFARGLPQLPMDAQLSAEWEPAVSRDETAELGRADIKINKLRIPPPAVWAELGYTQAEITLWSAELEARRVEAMEAQQQRQDQEPPGVR